MQKIVLSVLGVIVLAIGGWFGCQQYQGYQVRKAEHVRQLITEARQRSFQAAAEAEREKQIAAVLAARTGIGGAHKHMKITSLLPGNPGLAAVN